ncbi:hypothetical protein RHGRI_019809 [Rhododendron griersonianum]|uniref:NAC domain-containing protein n=1 Tax=Rhododendron griersonianum TaxID=479676 RepID=A0AAV6JIU2_9ERIC|nr:hypothetical protein RHGRI_019809 [Rhododendron griersonianum]
MNLSVNGQSSRIPPGFRFHPTEEELLHYYLRKKVASQNIDLDVIRDIDLNKLEPWDIQEKCRIGSTPQSDWYFFSHKDKKYPTGTRTNRATVAGFWKATGRDKVIYSSFSKIGMRKTLVFYKGRAPHGQKSDWIMHEYRLDDASANNLEGDAVPLEESWVVCRVFKQKNDRKAVERTAQGSISQMQFRNSSNNDITLDQIVQCMGRSCKQENETINNHGVNNFQYLPSALNGFPNRFMHLPRLEDAPSMHSPNSNYPCNNQDGTTSKACAPEMDELLTETTSYHNTQTTDGQRDGQNDWFSSDQLTDQEDTNNYFCFPIYSDALHPNAPNTQASDQVCSSEIDLWSFMRSSSSDPFHHLLV